ncbi:MAG: LuxR C-terminal-related transcriptional regulator [Tannerellaceae bacterium]|jgi:DNA-binding CsgD family transcriptional regulator|nr:LuxR C-terminal-related transcriptional regulator [Tannerellaceae bacterium]
MRRDKQIAIILSDTLQSAGLQSVLTDYFSPVEVSCFPSFAAFSPNTDDYDYYFIRSETFILNMDFFLPRRAKTVTLIHDAEAATQQPSGVHTINVKASQEGIIERLRQIFSVEGHHTGEKSKDLSAREIDVLQLIAAGCTNKDIADRLNISLNTVLTHRKNITAKLGIKTVSGLTFYAIMNGFTSVNSE